MSNRRNTWFYGLLIAMTSAAAALVIASRLGLAPESAAQTTVAPPMNSAPITGPLTASTFRDVAKTVMPAVVNIRTESRQRQQDLSEFFGGSDLFDRFFGPQEPRGEEEEEEEEEGKGSSVRASRSSRPQAPASSSTRPGSSSPITTSWMVPPESGCRYMAKTTIKRTTPR